jgi:hypothetical protein
MKNVRVWDNIVRPFQNIMETNYWMKYNGRTFIIFD